MGCCITSPKRVNPHVRHDGPPGWTRSLEYRDSFNMGFTDTSDGIHTVTPNHIIRERKGIWHSDAARWAPAFTEGKHVFEVFWPAGKNRGVCSCIGVASADAPIKEKGRVSLVGKHSESWGLDLSRRRSIHFNQAQHRIHLPLPPKFFMYLDMDSGKVGFGADVDTFGKSSEFYGWLLNNIPKKPDRPMYVMVSSCKQDEQIEMFYRGTAVPQGGFDLSDPEMSKRYRRPAAGGQNYVQQSLYPNLVQVSSSMEHPPPYPGTSGAPDLYQTKNTGAPPDLSVAVVSTAYNY